MLRIYKMHNLYPNLSTWQVMSDKDVSSYGPTIIHLLFTTCQVGYNINCVNLYISLALLVYNQTLHGFRWFGLKQSFYLLDWQAPEKEGIPESGQKIWAKKYWTGVILTQNTFLKDQVYPSFLILSLPLYFIGFFFHFLFLHQ